MNCTGKRCIMQFDKVDPATCKCVSYCLQATPPKTNADRIRSMSDDELAEWIERIRMLCANEACGQACPLIDICYSKAVEPTETLDWLRQEAEEGEI